MKYSFTSILLILFFSCSQKKAANFEAQNEHALNDHWTYTGETGPEHWKEIEKQSDCGGTKQSPINIITIDVIENDSLQPIEIHYDSHVRIHEITNNGHSIQYNFEKGDYIYIQDKRFDLVQIHFHEAAEHTINGIRYPLEMHMVHISSDNKIAVLAIMALEGESSEPFAFMERHLPVYINETKTIDEDFDLNLNLPENRDYFTYEGSLTTPPCSESVLWYIFKTPITISLEQVKQLKELMPINNYRDEQDLNGRVVESFTSTQ
jgi:carbonic anhydrase